MILQKPEGAWALYVLAHGAGAGMRHAFLKALSDALAAEGMATLRYEFPYMESRSRRIDSPAVLHARVREAVASAQGQGLPLFAGGKSMGGRMTSQAQALEPLPLAMGERVGGIIGLAGQIHEFEDLPDAVVILG